MEGEETDKMFRRANCKARVAYLNGSKAIEEQISDKLYQINEISKATENVKTFFVVFFRQ